MAGKPVVWLGVNPRLDMELKFMGIEIWPIIKLALRKTVGEAAFTNWINPLELRSLDKSKASFVAPKNLLEIGLTATMEIQSILSLPNKA